MSTIKIKAHTYSHAIQGVKVKPLADDGKEVSIFYDGLLSKAGAEQVYLHCGYGDTNDWDKVNDLPMKQVNNGWEKTLRIDTGSNLNFCFRDGSANWDNNSGDNWAYRISVNHSQH
ncbi:MAG: carbohydrate-binding protein [Desulfotomaculaceae bacterium]|nr:carbohydrate-binding protein [Desulfotomaculaceae bacterium]MDD4767571.1 carbohydrate-binding protein [Desulfotomaculaceae bacterium]